jgi:tRNA dimethylallyltransferase
MHKKEPLLIITGPTAVGKSKLSLDLALKFQGEIISADSMQVYRKMDIGTAKVNKEERKRVKHHLIDIIYPDQEFSVAEYQKMVELLISEITGRGNLPILVGGTGLYIKAVVEGLILPGREADSGLRKELRGQAKEYGNRYLHDKLKEIDPELAGKLHYNDLRRIIRGIEIYRQTGKPLSYFNQKQAEKAERYRTLKIGLMRNREELYQRINERIDEMLDQGLLEEVKGLLQDGYDLSTTSLQGIGYKEVIDYLTGEYTLIEAVEILKKNTRHYAKRQLTWFRRDKEIHWFNLTELSYNEVYQRISELVNNFITSDI